MSTPWIDRCHPPAGAAPQLMLDAWDYAAALLDRAPPPWTDASALVALARRTVGLLRPQVLALPLLPWFQQRLAGDARLLGLMRQRSRTAYAMKTALADPALRRELADTVAALCAALPGQAVVPVLAAPGLWLQAAFEAAQGRPADDIDEDLCEQAEVFLADLLRELAPVPIAALLLDEPLAQVDAAWAAVHTPVFNAAVHYRWSLGVAMLSCDGALPAPLCWAVSAQPTSVQHTSAGGVALALPATFWQADAALPAPAGLYAARVPVQAQPEAVLAQLERLRQQVPA